MTSATPPTPPRPGAIGSPATPPPPPGGPTIPPTTGPGGAGGAAVPPVQGSTDVLPAVVQKVAAFAARELPGVVDLGGSTSRAVSSVRQTLTGSSGESTAGVRVEMEGDTASLGLDVAIEYGVGARELVRSLRRHIPEAVGEIAGVTVTELNIVITDVRLPGGDEG